MDVKCYDEVTGGDPAGKLATAPAAGRLRSRATRSWRGWVCGPSTGPHGCATVTVGAVTTIDSAAELGRRQA